MLATPVKTRSAIVVIYHGYSAGHGVPTACRMYVRIDNYHLSLPDLLYLYVQLFFNPLNVFLQIFYLYDKFSSSFNWLSYKTL